VALALPRAEFRLYKMVPVQEWGQAKQGAMMNTGFWILILDFGF